MEMANMLCHLVGYKPAYPNGFGGFHSMTWLPPPEPAPDLSSGSELTPTLPPRLAPPVPIEASSSVPSVGPSEGFNWQRVAPSIWARVMGAFQENLGQWSPSVFPLAIRYHEDSENLSMQHPQGHWETQPVEDCIEHWSDHGGECQIWDSPRDNQVDPDQPLNTMDSFNMVEVEEKAPNLASCSELWRNVEHVALCKPSKEHCKQANCQ